MSHNIYRIDELSQQADPVTGKVVWSPARSVWLMAMYGAAIVGGFYTFSIEMLLLLLVTSVVTLCLGHSVGLHRRLIHNSFQCPLWLEYVLVYLGTLVGLGGPLGILKVHDLRDWAQNQPQCHDHFAHRPYLLKDWFWQLHCDIELEQPPNIVLEERISNDRFYQWLEKYWMAQQVPWIVLFTWLGGIDWIIWGVCMRVSVCVTCHWLVGHYAHTEGHKHWHVKGAAVQGYNIHYLGWLTMGECWHNNHHAYPGSARLGLHKNEVDPGWWLIVVLQKCGLAWDIKLPQSLASRDELIFA